MREKQNKKTDLSTGWSKKKNYKHDGFKSCL